MIDLENKTIKELKDYANSQNFNIKSKKKNEMLIEIQKLENQPNLLPKNITVNNFPLMSQKNSEFQEKQKIRFQNKIKNVISNFMSFAGYVLYIWNPRTMNCRLIPLPTITNELRVNKNETFYLGNPSLSIDGKPLFIIVRGIPYSIQTDLRSLVDLLLEFDFDKNLIKEKLPKKVFENPTMILQKGYTSNDIDTYNNSLVANRIFRIQRYTPTAILVITLLMICVGLITFMITSTYYQAIIESMKIK